MRKKYLSALLFGALLVTSAGTFTSCKDYDDDINNLQEQINTINTTLTELKGQIGDKGVTSVTFDEATGVLTVVDGSGTKTYTIKTASEAMCEAVIKDGVLYLNDEKVGPVVGEVKVDGNKLIVDGKEIAEIGSKVVLVKNLDEGTCDLTVDDETVTLPLASANVSLSNFHGANFVNMSGGDQTSEVGINWGKANNFKGEWKGSKPVAKGQLLVGKINSAVINVNPATFDLTTTKLTLVNTLGEEAPVTVTPVASEAEGPAVGNSRAASQTGEWALEIAMKETVTTENISTIFTAKNSQDEDKNVRYALAVNGTVVSGYNIYVDTDIKATTSIASGLLFTEDDVYYKINPYTYGNIGNLPLGTSEIVLHSFTTKEKIDNLYDSYIEIVDIDKAEAAGITAEGMKIIAPNTETASAVSDLAIKVHVLYVDGTVDEIETKVSFDNVELEAEDLGTQPCKLMPENSGIIIDLGETFTGLTAEEADKISKGDNWSDNSIWEFDKNSKTINPDGQYTIKYYASLEDIAAEEDKSIGLGAETTTIRTIKYAVISNNDIKSSGAEAGENKFTLTLRSTQDDELKKVTGIANVIVPTFEELFDKTTDKAWEGNVLSVNIDNTGKGTLPAAFKAKNASYSFTLAGIEAVEDNMMIYDKATAANATGSLTIGTEAVDKDGVLVPFNVIATYPVAGGKLIAKSSEFTIKTVSPLEGAQILNYDAEGKSIEIFTDKASFSLSAAKYDSKKKIYYSGAAIKVGTTTLGFLSGESCKIGGAKFDNNVPVANGQYNITAKFDAAAGSNATFDLTSGGFDISGLKAGEYVTVMTLTVEHLSGVKTVIPVSITVNIK